MIATVFSLTSTKILRYKESHKLVCTINNAKITVRFSLSGRYRNPRSIETNNSVNTYKKQYIQGLDEAILVLTLLADEF